MNFDKPYIIKDKGIIYDNKYNKFFILLSTKLNKYLITFNIFIN
jgi:hypothetical protein